IGFVDTFLHRKPTRERALVAGGDSFVADVETNGLVGHASARAIRRRGRAVEFVDWHSFIFARCFIAGRVCSKRLVCALEDAEKMLVERTAAVVVRWAVIGCTGAMDALVFALLDVLLVANGRSTFVLGALTLGVGERWKLIGAVVSPFRDDYLAADACASVDHRHFIDAKTGEDLRILFVWR